jgi:hypothetical protein
MTKRLTDDVLYQRAHRRAVRPGGLLLRQWLVLAVGAAAVGAFAASPAWVPTLVAWVL